MASFDEPYLIASSSSASSILPAQRSGAGFAWAQQKSGVHLTHTLHASTLASLSVGPSFQVEAPPVSSASEDEKRERWVAVVPGSKKSEREIWSWRANTDRDGSFASEPPRRTHKTEKQAIALCALPEDRLLYLCQDGTLVSTILGSETMTVQSTLQLGHATTKARLIWDPTYSPYQCAAFSFTSEGVYFNYVRIHKDQQLHLLASHLLPDSQDVVDASYSFAKRHLTALRQSGMWIHYTNTHDQKLESVRDLQLASSRFTFTAPKEQHSPSYLLPLHDSFILLALPTKSDSILCMLWDLKHGIALAESTHPAGRPTLVLPHTGLAVALISNITDTRICSLPFTLPAASTLSLVVGRAGATQAYLEQSPAIEAQREAEREERRQAFKSPVTKPAKAQLYDEQHEARKALLVRLNSVSVDVDAVFAEFLQVERRRIAKIVDTAHQTDKNWKRHNKRRQDMRKELEELARHMDDDDAEDGEEREDGDRQQQQEIIKEALAEKPRPEEQLYNEAGTKFVLYGHEMSPAISLTYSKQLVDICFKSLSTSQKTLRYLLERGVVSDDMVSPSLTLKLMQERQQTLTEIACQSCKEVPEEIMVQVYRLGQTQDPTSTEWLRLLVQRPHTPSALRRALPQLSTDDLAHVFKTTIAWLAEIDEQTMTAIPFYGRLSYFVSAVIDVHFVTILQNATLSDLLVQTKDGLRGQMDSIHAWMKADASVTMVQREAERAQKMVNSSTQRRSMRKAKKEMVEDYVLETFEV